VNAEERPTFTDLVSEFHKMLYEPQRYLHVPVCACANDLNSVLYVVTKYPCCRLYFDAVGWATGRANGL